MSRTRVRRHRLLVTSAIVAVGAFGATHAAGASSASSASPIASHRYVVRSGDTLWSIAERAGSGDPRQLVDAIARANHVEPDALVPGQTLVIPSA